MHVLASSALELAFLDPALQTQEYQGRRGHELGLYFVVEFDLHFQVDAVTNRPGVRDDPCAAVLADSVPRRSGKYICLLVFSRLFGFIGAREDPGLDFLYAIQSKTLVFNILCLGLASLGPELGTLLRGEDRRIECVHVSCGDSRGDFRFSFATCQNL